MYTLFYILSIVVAGVFTEAASNGTTSTTPVTVYYESLCPDSIKFITTKLIPTYTQSNYNFTSLISNLTLVPFGKANVTDAATNNFSCQHGPSECNGNKLHACAIKYITDEVTLLKYIGCLINQSTPLNKTLPYPTPEKCSAVLSSDLLKEISTCYTGSEGSELFISNGNKTSSFFKKNISFVPYISFNNILNDELSSKASSDFRKTLCSQVGVNNDVCTDTPKNAAATLTTSLTLIFAVLFVFFVRP